MNVSDETVGWFWFGPTRRYALGSRVNAGPSERAILGRRVSLGLTPSTHVWRIADVAERLSFTAFKLCVNDAHMNQVHNEGAWIVFLEVLIGALGGVPQDVLLNIWPVAGPEDFDSGLDVASNGDLRL